MANSKEQISSPYEIQNVKRFVLLKFSFWNLFVIGLLVWGISASAQQMPYYTQFKPNAFLLNPGVAGTKRLIDARIMYRNQWAGFQEAPVTQGFAVNGKLARGTMGLGLAYFSDKTGPSKRSDLSLAYAYHARFDDVELSVGIAGHSMTYLVDGTKMHMHIPYDNSIDLTGTQKKKAYDASAGVYFYNDRFHIGLSMLNLAEAKINFYAADDTIHKTRINMVPHMYGSVGYNWSGDPDWIWENSLQVLYARANPMTIDYNLRIHYKQKVFGGFSLRIRDAIGLHVGATIFDDFHFSYSYDIVISSLSAFQSGSHEIMLAWSSNLGLGGKKKYVNSEFRRQKYGFMF